MADTTGLFPDEDLELTVEAAFGADLDQDPDTWVWTDLSDRVIDEPISITRGVLVGGRTARGTSGTIALLNDDGALSLHHPGSPFWPNVDAGLPIRASIRTRTAPLLTDTFTRVTASGFGTADTGQTWEGGTLAAFVCTGTAGTASIAAVNSLRHHRAVLAHRDLDLTLDVRPPAVATGAALVCGPTIRVGAGGADYLHTRLEFGTGGAVRIVLRQVIANVGANIADVATGLAYTAATTVRVRVLAVGQRIRAKVWLSGGTEPGPWQADITLDAGVLASGTHSGVATIAVTGNSNTLPVAFTVDNLTISQPRYPRLEGFLADIRPTYLPLSDGSTHSVAVLDVGGIGTVLELRDADAWSPMRRGIQQATVAPFAYWPCEDADRAASAASGIVGQPALTVTGPTVFSFDTGEPDDSLISRYGSKNLCSLAGGARLSATFTPSPVQTAWTVGVTAQVTAAAVPVTEIRVLEWSTLGTFNRWSLVSTATGHAVRAHNDLLGTTTVVCASVEAINTLAGYDVQATQNGANIDVTLLIDTSVYATGSVAGTLGAPHRIAVNPDRANTTASTNPFGIRWLAGHLVIHDVATASSLPYYYDGPTLFRADRGWHGEPAHLRAARTAREGRVKFRLAASPDIATLLNSQPEGTTPDLMAAAVEAESGGLLYEAGHGYELLPRAARYNRPVDLTIDLVTYRRTGDIAATEVLQPQLRLREPTVWTVERTGGSQAMWAAAESYRKRRGNASDKKTLDLLADADLLGHAQWRVHLTEDARSAHYPGASIDLTANPDLIDDWLLIQPGSRIQRTNQPTIAGLDVIDQVMEGWTETLSRRGWLVAAEAAPYAPWRAAVQGVSVQQPSGTVLNAAITTTTATTFVLATVNPKNVWSTSAGMTIDINGEQISIPPGGVAAATGSGPYLQTVTAADRAVNGITKTHAAGSPVTLAVPDWLAL